MPDAGSRWYAPEMARWYVVVGFTTEGGGMIRARDERSREFVLLRPEDFGVRLLEHHTSTVEQGDKDAW